MGGDIDSRRIDRRQRVHAILNKVLRGSGLGSGRCREENDLEIVGR